MLVAMRCNVDVQDLRRVLPPYMWMPEEQLECEGVEAEGKSYNHGAFPQRYSAFSLGEQSHWAWFKHLGTTAHQKHKAVCFVDWLEHYQQSLKKSAPQ